MRLILIDVMLLMCGSGFFVLFFFLFGSLLFVGFVCEDFVWFIMVIVFVMERMLEGGFCILVLFWNI